MNQGQELICSTIKTKILDFDRQFKNQNLMKNSKMSNIEFPLILHLDPTSFTHDKSLPIIIKNIGGSHKINISLLINNHYLVILQEVSKKFNDNVQTLLKDRIDLEYITSGRVSIIVNKNFQNEDVLEVNKISNKLSSMDARYRTVDLVAKIHSYHIKIINIYFQNDQCEQKYQHLKEIFEELKCYNGFLLLTADFNFNTSNFENAHPQDSYVRYLQLIDEFKKDHDLVSTQNAFGVRCTNFGSYSCSPDLTLISTNLKNQLNLGEFRWDLHSTHCSQRISICESDVSDMTEFSDFKANGDLLVMRNIYSGRKNQMASILTFLETKLKNSNSSTEQAIKVQIKKFKEKYDEATELKDNMTEALKKGPNKISSLKNYVTSLSSVHDHFSEEEEKEEEEEEEEYIHNISGNFDGSGATSNNSEESDTPDDQIKEGVVANLPTPNAPYDGIPLPFYLQWYLLKRYKQEVQMITVTRFDNIVRSLENLYPKAKELHLDRKRVSLFITNMKNSNNIIYDHGDTFQFKEEYLKSKFVKRPESTTIEPRGRYNYISVDLIIQFNKIGANYSEIANQLNEMYESNFFQYENVRAKINSLLKSGYVEPRDGIDIDNAPSINFSFSLVFTEKFIQESIINVDEGDDRDVDIKSVLCLHKYEKTLIFPLFWNSLDYELPYILPIEKKLGIRPYKYKIKCPEYYPQIAELMNKQIVNGVEPLTYSWKSLNFPANQVEENLTTAVYRVKHIYYKFNGSKYIERTPDEVAAALIKENLKTKDRVRFKGEKIDWTVDDIMLLWRACRELTYDDNYPNFPLIREAYFPKQDCDTLRRKYISFFTNNDEISSEESSLIYDIMVGFNQGDIKCTTTIYTYIKNELKAKLNIDREYRQIKQWWEGVGKLIYDLDS
ncbi:uncharacterized protein KGF55_005469 [Candida pseudojiufengensis]|uniref:uncharacterized protein n=1 Tax=Candida pseudojiufengensis TaxID=497109 RepID=UPI0022254A72|nr:uncharacterized protein KGF55_005469 [Candida pseudojiufengensis]KAI5959319.1 hypothetical protein KGF55_005469 [Candida pseudojiufengensis]